MLKKNGIPDSSSGRSALEVAERTVREAGDTLRDAFRGSFSVDKKGRGNYVTDVDRRIEDAVVSTLRREYPDVGVLGEESGGTDVTSPYSWIVDPIDGTANFVRGIPQCATTLALLGPDGEPVLGCTYDPVHDDYFVASIGGGAFVNGKRMRPGALDAISDGMLGIDLPYGDDLVETSFDVLRELLPVQRVRMLGSGALGFAYLAAGWLDLYVHLSLKPWDVAAGLLMVREAGLETIDAHGRRATPDSGSFVSGNDPLLREFLARTARLTAAVPRPGPG